MGGLHPPECTETARTAFAISRTLRRTACSAVLRPSPPSGAHFHHSETRSQQSDAHGINTRAEANSWSLSRFSRGSFTPRTRYILLWLFFYRIMTLAKQNPVQLGIYQTLHAELGVHEIADTSPGLGRS